MNIACAMGTGGPYLLLGISEQDSAFLSTEDSEGLYP